MAYTAPPAEPVRVKAIMRDTTKGPIWFQAVAFFWFISTFAVFPGNAFFLYPLSAEFMVIFYFKRDRIMPLLAKCWWMFLIPSLALLSVTWSGYPASTIRLGLFFTDPVRNIPPDFSPSFFVETFLYFLLSDLTPGNYSLGF